MNSLDGWGGYLTLVSLAIPTFYWIDAYLNTHYPDEEEL